MLKDLLERYKNHNIDDEELRDNLNLLLDDFDVFAILYQLSKVIATQGYESYAVEKAHLLNLIDRELENAG